LSIDGRQRENLAGHSNMEKWFITRTKSRLIIGMAILGYSILVKRTKLIISKRLGQGPDGEGLLKDNRINISIYFNIAIIRY